MLEEPTLKKILVDIGYLSGNPCKITESPNIALKVVESCLIRNPFKITESIWEPLYSFKSRRKLSTSQRVDALAGGAPCKSSASDLFDFSSPKNISCDSTSLRSGRVQLIYHGLIFTVCPRSLDPMYIVTMWNGSRLLGHLVCALFLLWCEF